MRNTLKKILLFALIGCFVVGSLTFILWHSMRTTKLRIEYASVEGGLSLKKYNGTSENTRLVIPDASEGQAIIALEAFSVSNALYLEELTIGANVRDIHPWAVTNCQALRRVEVDPANAYFTSVDGVLYSRDMTRLILFPNMNSARYIIPDSVEIIGENAFYKCRNLAEIQFSPGPRTIEDRAFFRCDSLKLLQLPGTLETIGADAFSFCDALEGDLYIPASCREIGDYAFSSKGSKISRICILAKENEIRLGKDWVPLKEKKANAKVEFEFVEVYEVE